MVLKGPLRRYHRPVSAKGPSRLQSASANLTQSRGRGSIALPPPESRRHAPDRALQQGAQRPDGRRQKQGKPTSTAAGRCNTCHSPTGDLAGIGKEVRSARPAAEVGFPADRRFRPRRHGGRQENRLRSRSRPHRASASPASSIRSMTSVSLSATPPANTGPFHARYGSQRWRRTIPTRRMSRSSISTPIRAFTTS
jgi:hypothetical protein